MTTKQKRERNWIRNISYLGGFVSLVFIMIQVYLAGRSMTKSSEWEKAKMTIENIERFREDLRGVPLGDVWMLGDGIWADFSTSKGWQLSDTLRVIHFSLFDNNESKMFEDYLRMIDIMDAFAYPIIMGYASEVGSYKNVARQFHTYGNFVIASAFHHTTLIGLHAKLLHKLWRVRYEIMVVEMALADNNKVDMMRERADHLLCYEWADFSEASLEGYRKKLNRELKKIQKEIVVFRKNSLK